MIDNEGVTRRGFLALIPLAPEAPRVLKEAHERWKWERMLAQFRECYIKPAILRTAAKLDEMRAGFALTYKEGGHTFYRFHRNAFALVTPPLDPDSAEPELPEDPEEWA